MPEKSYLHCLRVLVMSWLFKNPVVTIKALTVKDPFNSDLAQFDHAQSNSKKLPQMTFVLEKQLIKFSCTYQPLSICKIFIKKILELIQNYDVRHFSHQNSPFVLNKLFLGINHCYYFHLPMALFIVQNLKEILQWIQNYDDAPFLGPKWSIYLK